MRPLDHLSIRDRPGGNPALHQTWRSLLFLHWKADPAALRALVPPALGIDIYDGWAWVGVTPFTMTGIRPPFLPALPFVSRSHELNVRTYVVHEGTPGVWFFSLDAANPLAVAAARRAYRLPYFRARMTLREQDDTIRFSCVRRGVGPGGPEFRCAWRRLAPIPTPAPDSRLFFLTERYCLFATHRGTLYRARIHHRPWDLHEGEVLELLSTMLTAQALPCPAEPPLAHAQGAPLPVQIWPLEAAGPSGG